jgi:hypothetical protein
LQAFRTAPVLRPKHNLIQKRKPTEDESTDGPVLEKWLKEPGTVATKYMQENIYTSSILTYHVVGLLHVQSNVISDKHLFDGHHQDTVEETFENDIISA